MTTFSTKWVDLVDVISSSQRAMANRRVDTPSVDLNVGRGPRDTVTVWVKSNQEKVVFSMNPISLEEDAQTKLMNRAIDLGYEPATISTVNPLSR